VFIWSRHQCPPVKSHSSALNHLSSLAVAHRSTKAERLEMAVLLFQVWLADGGGGCGDGNGDVLTCAGERQLHLTKALERTPSSSFVEALESFVTWMVNAEQLLASEAFVVDKLEVMEHQLSQYLVRLVLTSIIYLLNSVGYFKLYWLSNCNEVE